MDAPATPPLIRLSDYAPPAWRVPAVELRFELDPGRTLVHARLTVERGDGSRGPLRLDGEGLDLLDLSVDGRPVPPAERLRDPAGLTIPIDGDRAVVETVVAIEPAANTRLMGLYASGGNLCTQCEAEGFRRITFFPDRPDVLSRYHVRLEADAARFPVLLSNGNPAGAGTLPDGRHFAEWDDPHPKPSYLFALVAGRLEAMRDRFVTRSGRAVDLAIWVEAGDVPRCAHAMAALKAAMAWDEAAYGREYDLDMFNIVAVHDFNFGAMENKGLNIFNAKYILADAETATDADFDAVAAVVAHEYFHNWTGNRITCRDWFQLALKEGLTVFRDQQFSADQGSPAVRRIEDVRSLRAIQFPEDGGPLAHPVRPESYIEISNFYTATIYNKGAELIRMMATLLAPERFRAGMDRYFERHDGRAATIEDFVSSIEAGGGIDLAQFRRWYEQAGTPRLRVEVAHDAAAATATLTVAQHTPPTPGQPVKAPLHMPLRVALFDRDNGAPVAAERVIELREAETAVRFEGVRTPPVPSLNRGFSAPVIVEADLSPADLALLARVDDDPFARYEALQRLMSDVLVAAAGEAAGRGPPNSSDGARAVVDAVAATLAGDDPAFIAEAVLLPSELMIAERLGVVDPDAVHAAREALRRALAERLRPTWWDIWHAGAPGADDLSPAAKGQRRLRSVALGYLMVPDAAGRHDDEATAAAFLQFADAATMTDRMGALTALASSNAAEREAALAMFRRRFEGDATVMDKWFAAQALSTRPDTVDAVGRLTRDPLFNPANPNRFRALIGSFAANQVRFHGADGRGYALVEAQILSVDRLNPQSAARLAAPLGRWRRLEPRRAALMRASLERIAGTSGLSRDVHELVTKSLRG